MDNSMNVSGEYVFYEDGKEVGRNKNLITKFGKRYLTQYLAGQSNTNLKDIAVGIGGGSSAADIAAGRTAASVNDTQLRFEFYRSPVTMSSIDIQTNSTTGISSYGVVHKTTIPVDVVGVISEIGIFPTVSLSSTDYASNSISTFEDNQSWADSSGAFPSVLTTPTPKIGTYYLSMGAAASGTKQYFNNFNIDISGYSALDSLTIAYRQVDLNLDYVFVRMYDSNNNYYEIRYAGDVSTGDKIKSLTLNNFYSSGYGVGAPDQTSIVKIGVGVKAKSSGSTAVLFDGLRINDEDAFRTDYGLISRSVLSTPIVKTLGKQMVIEYRIGINF
jgi:hypothetical protein